MTDKEKKSKIADILMDFQEEYSNEVINRPMLASLYAGNILSFIDSVQKEPVPKIFEDMLNAKTPAESLGISQEEHDRIVDELIYGKEPELVDVDNLPNKEEGPVSEDLETKLDKYIKANFTIDKEQLDRFGVEEKDYMYSMDKEDMLKMVRHFTSNYRVPVSNDLETEIEQFFKPYFNIDGIAIKGLEDDYPKVEDLKDIARHFANWQKEKLNYPFKDNGNPLNDEIKDFTKWIHDQHLTPTITLAAYHFANWQKKKDNQDESDMAVVAYMDGAEKGKKLMREQIMKDAIDVEVKVDAGGYPYIPQMELYDYDKDVPLAKEGEKVKVIVIKED